jgi:hypothetical protein
LIIVNIIGGLGNQMFQYAMARVLAKKLCVPLHISTDLFHGYKFHNGYELQRVFGIDVPIAKRDELKSIIGWQQSPVFRKYFGRPSLSVFLNQNWCNEPHFNFWPKINSIQNRTYLHGYWQSERYFDAEVELIRTDFKFSMPWSAEDKAVYSRMKVRPSVSLHVRRKDYLLPQNRKVFAICDVDYYRAAISLISERIKDVRFYVFTDSPDWVEHGLLLDYCNYEIIRHNSDLLNPNDMRLMSLADHHIIANSSFSWWGAWLNPSVKKIVVAPKVWFVNGTDDSDLIPKTWFRV